MEVEKNDCRFPVHSQPVTKHSHKWLWKKINADGTFLRPLAPSAREKKNEWTGRREEREGEGAELAHIMRAAPLLQNWFKLGGGKKCRISYIIILTYEKL